MAVNNNAKIIRREILARISSILINEQDLSSVDRIALKMRPKNGDHVRCCIYRDRAVIKYKIMAMLGFNEDSDSDELKSLTEYIEEALNGNTSSAPLLNVANEACSSCQKTNYSVTNMCQGCVGRPCMVNCPKNAITFIGKQATIDHELCVNCGLCQKLCPFHAIIYTPVPCEESCPVGAIEKGENEKELIDIDKCILCGKCLEACPFGAIVEKTDLFKVIESVKANEEIIAMVAPSIAGQFMDDMPRIMGGFKSLGFTDVKEVALGADITIKNESEEFKDKLEEGLSMTTSCCPSYINLVKMHGSELLPYVSTTLSPMEYTAIELKKTNPHAKLVFVGPCVAKKGEALQSPNIDFVINYEEFGAWLIASGIELSECTPIEADSQISKSARYFAQAGGVSTAVAEQLKSFNFDHVEYEGIDKRFLNKLRVELKNKSPRFVEVMSCDNGCIGGCSSLTNPRIATRQLKKFIN